MLKMADKDKLSIEHDIPDASTNHLIVDRLKKLESLMDKGVNPYEYNFNATHSASDLQDKFSYLKPEEYANDTKVSVAGRIMLKRRMGKIAFVTVQDNFDRVQLYFAKEDLGEDNFEIFKMLDIGDFVGVSGRMFKTKTGEVTVYVDEFKLLSKSLRPLPDKFHGLKDEELKFRKRYLDLIMNPEVSNIFFKRAKIYSAIREFLNSKGFVEVQVPIIQTMYGGANARPFISHVNAWDMPVYLRIAYELHLKRLLVAGFKKIYDLGFCFRNEGVDRTHNPEFAMMEIQWANSDYADAMVLTEELWEFVATAVNGSSVFEIDGKKIDVKAPWRRLSVFDALKEFADLDVNSMSDSELVQVLDEHKIDRKLATCRGDYIVLLFEELCEDKLIDPVHIIDFPKESAPLAKLHRSNPDLVEKVEPYINGWEVGNSYSELTDPILQRKLLKEQAERGRAGDDEAHPFDEDYVEALEFGLPPNCGIGIGVERMVMLLTGSKSLRESMLFPTMKPEEKTDSSSKSK